MARRDRMEAVALVLTAQTGAHVTADMLLGTEDEAKAALSKEAEKKVAAMNKRMKNVGIPSLKDLANSAAGMVRVGAFDEGTP